MPKRASDTALEGATFRSGAVARMASMPVATLRIWEQRYRAVQPATAPSGHRLYSPADLQRVLLLRRLTEQGHAIGAIAGLDSDELQKVVLAADTGRTAAGVVPKRASEMRLVVVGAAFATRLQRPAVARQLAPGVRVTAVFDSLAEASLAKPGTRADLLLWHAPGLQAATPAELAAARTACRARQVAVVYRFAGSRAIEALTDSGAFVTREPADDAALGSWLRSVHASLPEQAADDSKRSPPDEPIPTALRSVAPRRFDDAALTAIAGLSPTLACECPSHLADLLMQLSSFESYSADCMNRTEKDAELHAYLHQVAGAARALFEAALERVAKHEGLPLD